MISGILPVDKPPGWTSHDVVARLRRVAGQKQIGHAGTLDPLATGVLVVVLGKATKLSHFLMAAPKVYCAELVLGATTATDDAEAPLQEWRDTSGITRVDLETCLARFMGEIEQVPPQYAAIKTGGEKLYALARRGVEVRPEPRRVTIHEIKLERWEPPRARLLVRCRSGTYIRSLARDIGAALGVGGYLHALRRLASGKCTIDQTHALDQIASADDVRRALRPMDLAVIEWPAMVLGQQDGQRVRHGLTVRVERPIDGPVRLYEPSGELLALGDAGGGEVRPIRVFTGG